MNNITEIIKNICEEEQIKISDLEKRAGLSRSSLSKWKNELPKSITSLVKIAQILNVSTDYLLGLDNSSSSGRSNNSIMELIISKTANSELEWERIEYSKLKNNPLKLSNNMGKFYTVYFTTIKNNKVIFIYKKDKCAYQNDDEYYLFLNKNGEYIPINYKIAEINKLYNLIINQNKRAILELLGDLQE